MYPRNVCNAFRVTCWLPTANSSLMIYIPAPSIFGAGADILPSSASRSKPETGPLAPPSSLKLGFLIVYNIWATQAETGISPSAYCFSQDIPILRVNEDRAIRKYSRSGRTPSRPRGVAGLNDTIHLLNRFGAHRENSGRILEP